MSLLRASAPPSRPAILAALSALVLHSGAAFLVLRAPGVPVEQPPIPLEVRFVVEAPPPLAQAPQSRPQPEPEPRAEPKPEPRPVVRRTPPQKTPQKTLQKTPPAPASEQLVAESPRAAPEAPTAMPAAPAPPVETVPAAPPVQAAAAPPPVASAGSSAASAGTQPTSAPRFDAAYLANPPPAYPMISRRLGEEGRVLLRVHVEPDGRPSSVELRDSSGYGRLDDAAMRAVRGWRFVPAKRGDQPVAAWVLVPINFTLKNS